MTLKLKILPRAQEDVQHIFEYLAERSLQGAADWWEAFESAARNATDGLSEHPLAPENNSTEFGIRTQASHLQDACRAALPIRFYDRRKRIQDSPCTRTGAT